MTTYSDRIIDALGGTTAVSRKTAAPISTVHSWRKNGIPESRLAHLKLIAQEEGIQVDWSTGLPLDGSNGGSADHVDSDTTGGPGASSGSSKKISAEQVSA